MGKKRSKDKIKIGNPQQQLEELSGQSTRYKLGEKGVSFHEIKSRTPVFAFDYLSLSSTGLCFDSKTLITEDYLGFLRGLKKLSNITYEDLKRIPNYRFHSIDFTDPRVCIPKKEFKKILTNKSNLLADDELPTLYQIDIQYVSEARVCGFLYKGIFYIVWYDRNHAIYKRK